MVGEMTRINLDFSENRAKKITKIQYTPLKTHGVDTSHTVYIAHDTHSTSYTYTPSTAGKAYTQSLSEATREQHSSMPSGHTVARVAYGSEPIAPREPN